MMTKITTTTEDRVERINEILSEMVRHIEEKEDLTKDFADVLHLFFPGEEHHLFTPADWRHTPALETEIIGWLAGSADEEETLQDTQRKVLMDGESMVWVHAKHLLDDHWKISVFGIVSYEENEEMQEFPDGDAGLNPAMAVARIAGSGGRLPRTGSRSARLT